MIKKLANKFIIILTASVFTLLLVTLGIINFVNFSLVSNEADQITLILENNRGSFGGGGENQGGEPPSTSTTQTTSSATAYNAPPAGPGSPETQYSTRFFTFRFDADGNVEEIAFNISEETATKQEATEWARSLLNSTIGWSRTYYRYRVYTIDSYDYVSVIDYSRELSPSYNVLIASIIGTFVGTAVTFAVGVFASKKLVKPIADSDRKQKRFIADAARNLKTPTTIIGLDNEEIRAKHGDSEYVDSIAKEVSKLKELVKDLNDLVIYEEKDASKEDFNLSNVLNDVLMNYQDAFSGKKLDLKLDIKEDVILNSDPQMIRKLFSELTENQLKYADSKAEIKLEQEQERITLYFINDAKDVPDGELDTIFNRFYRMDIKKHALAGGSGVGLSIAKAIINDLHGRIRAYASEGVFTIKIEL